MHGLEWAVLSSSFKEHPEQPPETETPDVAFERRRKLLNENQVLASIYFVRRLGKFLRYIAKNPDILGGKLMDWVIRYETQGRGSVHAHMLWWVELDPERIHEDDVVHLTEEEEQRYGLMVENQATQETCPLYDQLLLDYANGNIWAMKNIANYMMKLRIQDPEETRVIVANLTE